MDLKPSNILRKSIHTLLQKYLYFTCLPALLALPFAAAILLSQIYVPSSLLLATVLDRINTLFEASGFPASSKFVVILSQKLSQTISSVIFALPFTLTFLLLSKASIIHHFLSDQKAIKSPLCFDSLVSIFNPLFVTYLCNSLLILSANATAFFILFISFNLLQGLGFTSSNYLLLFSASGIVIYSVIVANILIICNMSLVLSGIERSGGYISILKACVMIRGRAATALSLVLPVSLTMAAVEALFQYRIVKNYNAVEGPSSSMVLEGMFIAYLYSILVVLDTIVSCVFFKACKKESSHQELEECRYGYRIEIAEADHEGRFISIKVTEHQ